MIVDAMTHGMTEQVIGQDNIWIDPVAEWSWVAGCSNRLSARPQRVKSRGVPLGYVEGLNDARTMLADFFSSLFVKRRSLHGKPGLSQGLNGCQSVLVMTSVIAGRESPYL